MKKHIEVLMLVVVLALAGAYLAPAQTNWTPSGSVSLSLMDKYIHPTLSLVKYDEQQALLDLWANLPKGFSIQLSEYAGFDDRDLDSNKGDEFDLNVWKKFTLAQGAYLKLRFKYADGYPISDTDGLKDALAYDAFLGRTFRFDQNSVTPELRVEYWHYIHDANGMVTIIPSLNHEYQVNQHFSVYDQLVLQWNNELAPFGELLSGQAKLGAKARVLPNLAVSLEVWAIEPFETADEGDPRTDGDRSVTCSINYKF